MALHEHKSPENQFVGWQPEDLLSTPPFFSLSFPLFGPKWFVFVSLELFSADMHMNFLSR